MLSFIFCGIFFNFTESRPTSFLPSNGEGSDSQVSVHTNHLQGSLIIHMFQIAVPLGLETRCIYLKTITENLIHSPSKESPPPLQPTLGIVHFD